MAFQRTVSIPKLQVYRERFQGAVPYTSFCLATFKNDPRPLISQFKNHRFLITCYRFSEAWSTRNHAALLSISINLCVSLNFSFLWDFSRCRKWKYFYIITYLLKQVIYQCYTTVLERLIFCNAISFYSFFFGEISKSWREYIYRH